MTKLIFKVKEAGEDSKSPIEIVLGNDKLIARDTDQLLQTLDKLLKKNKIKVEDINPQNIRLEVDKKAGLTSQRIVKAVIKALRLNLP